eukprot:PhM_4_TR5924/c2_g1_i2/m.71539
MPRHGLPLLHDGGVVRHAEHSAHIAGQREPTYMQHFLHLLFLKHGPSPLLVAHKVHRFGLLVLHPSCPGSSLLGNARFLFHCTRLLLSSFALCLSNAGFLGLLSSLPLSHPGSLGSSGGLICLFLRRCFGSHTLLLRHTRLFRFLGGLLLSSFAFLLGDARLLRFFRGPRLGFRELSFCLVGHTRLLVSLFFGGPAPLFGDTGLFRFLGGPRRSLTAFALGLLRFFLLLGGVVLGGLPRCFRLAGFVCLLLGRRLGPLLLELGVARFAELLLGLGFGVGVLLPRTVGLVRLSIRCTLVLLL